MDIPDYIEAVRQHREGALEELRRQDGPLILYILGPILPDQRDREECLNDVLLRVWDRIGQFDPNRGSWQNWLCTIARNAAIDRARKNPPAPAPLTETIQAPKGNPEEIWLDKEQRNAVLSAIRSLPPGDKLLFYRKYYYRQPTAQIAAELGTTERAVEGRLYRIRGKLKKLLGGEWNG